MNLEITRLFNGEPILAPIGNTWQRTCTANSCAILLARETWSDRVLAQFLTAEQLQDSRLAQGVVVSLYTGVGKREEDLIERQSRGLAFFTPDLELILRLPYPVLLPSEDSGAIDSQGIEDVRLTVHDGVFYAWYCGYNGKDGAACVGYSSDLLHWEKTAPLPGDINQTYNKDHVVFPHKINGKWWMLHRPWGPEYPDVNDMVIRLANSDDLLGPWMDAGEILRDVGNPERRIWTGGGAAPIPLGENRFLMIYHTGSFFEDGARQYNAAAALLDLSKYTPNNPQAVVVGKLDPLMIPETSWEKNADLRINIIFPMGAYLYGKDLIITYGAGDRFTCAAKLDFDQLLEILEQQEKTHDNTERLSN